MIRKPITTITINNDPTANANPKGDNQYKNPDGLAGLRTLQKYAGLEQKRTSAIKAGTDQSITEYLKDAHGSGYIPSKHIVGFRKQYKLPESPKASRGVAKALMSKHFVSARERKYQDLLGPEEYGAGEPESERAFQKLLKSKKLSRRLIREHLG